MSARMRQSKAALACASETASEGDGTSTNVCRLDLLSFPFSAVLFSSERGQGGLDEGGGDGEHTTNIKSLPCKEKGGGVGGGGGRNKRNALRSQGGKGRKEAL